MNTILFVGVHNAGRSRMAGAFFNRPAAERGLDTRAESAGAAPGEAVNPQAVHAMEEAGTGVAGHRPKPLPIRPPVVQIAIDVLDVDRALRVAEAAVRAGVDWLEAGTPLITFQGVQAIGALARAFPDTPVLADFKMMDGVRKYVLAAAEQGGRIATICGVASDASIRAAVQAGRDSGVRIICDLYAALDGPARAREVQALGVDSAYIHYGADQRGEDPRRDPALFLDEVAGRMRIPVGVGTFSAADGVDAVRRGADIVVIGVPLILEDDPTAGLREYVLRVKEAWHARAGGAHG